MFTLTSTDVADGRTADKRHAYDGNDCEGRNLSPELRWKDAPEGTKSYAVTLFDPDAGPLGWWHWLLFDLPPATTGLPRGAGAQGKLPRGAMEAINDFGGPGYGGPCPPKGGRVHRYVLTVHALNVDTLGLDAKATPREIGRKLERASIAHASITFLYER